MAAAASDDGSKFVIGAKDGSLAVHRRGAGGPVWKVRGAHDGSVDLVAFSPRGGYVASASRRDRRLRVWNASSGTKEWQSTCDGSFAFCSEELLATCEAIHSVTRGDALAQLEGSAPVAASPDGRFVFVGDEEQEAGTVWYLPALLAK